VDAIVEGLFGLLRNRPPGRDLCLDLVAPPRSH